MTFRFERSLLLVTVACMAYLAGCGSASTEPTHHQVTPSRTYSLPSSGWKPGDPRMLAAGTGVFQAALSKSGACAWLETPASNQPRKVSFLWPAGYAVRFNPTELIDANGHVVAHGGDHISVGGGFEPTPHNWCTPAGDSFLVESGIIRK